MAWSTPSTFVAGATLTAAQLNAMGGDLAILGGAWTDDTAARASSAIWTTTGASVGNGTLVSRYRLAGKTLDWLIILTFGSTTSAGSTQFTFAYPGGVSILNAGALVNVRLFDSSATSTYLATGVVNAATVNLDAIASAAGLLTTVNNASPFTWATGDVCAFLLTGGEVA